MFATPAGTTPDEWRGPCCVDHGTCPPPPIAHGTYCGARGRSSQHERVARSSSKPHQPRQQAVKRGLPHWENLTWTFSPLLTLRVTEMCQTLYMAGKSSSRAFRPLFTDLKTPSDGRERWLGSSSGGTSSALWTTALLGLRKYSLLGPGSVLGVVVYPYLLTDLLTL